MTNRTPASSQNEPITVEASEYSTSWEWGQESLLDPMPALAAEALSLGIVPSQSRMTSLQSDYPAKTDSAVSQAPTATADWRAELKARYKAMPKTAWFKTVHEDRSLGESIKIS